MTRKLTPKERRLQREIEKQANIIEKTARFSASITIDNKIIRNEFTPELKSYPRSIEADTYKNTAFSWCHSRSDNEGNWSWGEPRNWTDDEYKSDIYSCLSAQVNNSWNEVEKATYNGKKKYRKILNKYQPVSSICKEAQLRWADQLDLSQFDELFRLRLGGKKRLWGIRVQHHFFLIWYERNHKICPIKN